MMPPDKQLYFETRIDFREWLEHNHGAADSFDMLFYKKHTKKPCINYNDAVEEALCFGWIDGKLKKIDDDRYIRHFSPRSSGSAWSDKNIERMEKLIKNKMVQPEAVALFMKAKKKGFNRKKDAPVFTEPPEELRIKLRGDKEAEGMFQSLTEREKTAYYHFIGEAKRETTKEKRLNEMIWKLKDGWRMPYFKPK